jgi:hypothetical protein
MSRACGTDAAPRWSDRKGRILSVPWIAARGGGIEGSRQRKEHNSWISSKWGSIASLSRG